IAGSRTMPASCRLGPRKSIASAPSPRRMRLISNCPRVRPPSRSSASPSTHAVPSNSRSRPCGPTATKSLPPFTYSLKGRPLMSTLFISKLAAIAEKAAGENEAAFEAASKAMSETLANGGLVHLYGSGHSVLPVQETYPRYGSYLGFNPLTDPRVMWHNILGAGGVRELLWLERTEKYAEKFLDHQPLNPGDTIVIFGHSGSNASGIDTALYAKER